MNNSNVAKIQLNGNPYEINTETNLNQLLNKLKIKKTKVAIEVNGAIVEKNKYPKVIRRDFKREKFANKKFIKKGKFRKKHSHYSKERKYNFDNKKSANY